MGEVEGTPFGRYRLVDLLGRGGMGEVWRAYDPVVARFVALKVLPATFADDAVFQERFRREARAAAGLDEPHVVPIYDSGEIDGRLFVSMRLVKGRDLQDLLRAGPLPPGRVVGIIDQIASALQAAHEVGLVHRDVKPSNILVAAKDFAYLIDFGIARAAGEQGLTSTGSTIGTWAYMAPERFQRGVADARCDTYALACVLFEGLTGSPPFPAVAFEQIAVAHMFEPPPQPSRLRAGISEAMDAVIATGMAKNPAERYTTTKDLARAARAALSTQPPRATPHPAPPKPPPPIAHPPTTPPHPSATTNQQASRPRLFAHAQSQPAQNAPPQRPRRQRKTVLLAAAGVTVTVVIGLIALVTQQHPSPPSSSPTRSIPSGLRPYSSLPGSQPDVTPYGAQTVLPFTGLTYPRGVAVDGGGAVYVTDAGNNRVLKLAAGSSAPTLVRFAGLNYPFGVAVDGGGAVYVTDQRNNRVLKLMPGSNEQTVLPFIGIGSPQGVAVDRSGAIYVTEAFSTRVLKLLAGSSEQTVPPFTGLLWVGGVAVDGGGAVYVADSMNKRVLKLAAGSGEQTVLPFIGLTSPSDVAVDGDGAVYVADSLNNRVLKLAAGSSEPTVLPFTGLSEPSHVAVDGGGAVYVTETLGTRVLKLPRR